MAEGAVEVECVLPARAQTGESPFWSEREQALYWIDIQEPALHRFDPPTGRDRAWTLPAEIGCFTLCDDGSSALVGLRSGLHRLDLRSGEVQLLVPPPYDPALFRFNEGKCDSAGRFWLGTMFDPLDKALKNQDRRGHLYSYTASGGLVTHDDLAIITNGMAWDASGTTMYLAHTVDGTIATFDFDAASGRLSGRRLFATVPKEAGEPDGAAMDVGGGYWSALHTGGRLRRFMPDGTIQCDLTLPVSSPTMCAFGGPDLADLYITTAVQGVPDPKRRRLDGGLFRCRPGVRGQAAGRLFKTT